MRNKKAAKGSFYIDNSFFNGSDFLKPLNEVRLILSIKSLIF